MSKKFQVVTGSLVGAVAIHVALVACYSNAPNNSADSGVIGSVMDAARDVLGMETPDAHAQDAATGCNCPTGPRVRTAYIAQNAGSYLIGSQDGNWVANVVKTGVGEVVLNLNPGAFSGDPVCSIANTGGSVIVNVVRFTREAVAVRMLRYLPSGTPPMDPALDQNFGIICVGP